MKLFGRGRLLLGVLAGALASVALAWILFDPGHDASRVYYGTDTHAVGLLAGVALALVWSPIELRRRRTGPLVGPVLDAVGVLALAYIVLSFLHVHDYDLALWHGGYLWLALVTALLLAVLAHPAARLGGLLGAAAGALARPALLLLLPLALPGADADPPRPRRLPAARHPGPAAAAGRPRPRRPLLPLRRAPLPRQGEAPRAPRQLAAGGASRPDRRRSLAIVALVGWSGLFAKNSGHARSRRLDRHRRPSAECATVDDPAERRERAAALPRRRRIVALGDSVMIGAKDKLAARLGPGFSMSAEVGRQADEFVAIAQRLKREGHAPDAMIIQMGNNGPLYSDEMEALRKATSDVGELFLIDDHAPVSWIGRVQPRARRSGRRLAAHDR